MKKKPIATSLTARLRAWKARRKLYRENVLKQRNSFWNDFMQATRAYSETLRAFIRFRHKQPCITLFGSARLPQNSPFCSMAYEVTTLLAQAKFKIMTGGGPGIMEAANRAAHDANAVSLAATMQIPGEDKPNDYIHVQQEFRYFFVRKLILTKYSDGFIILPGGMGTLDEVFEIATLIKNERIDPLPLVIMGKDYWNPLMDFIRSSMLKHQAIDESFLKLFYLTDSASDAVNYIQTQLEKKIK